ncbi:MAG: carboxypeptidase regulatory-like domain-containing protein [Planctomycetales bacterium]|nr:carboxypeptidase regulatory-like domain-containing protein [Planctomycetales bacterium]
MTFTRRPLVIALVLASLLVRPAAAWGPHTEITLAALRVLPNRERWQKYFGHDWDRIARDYCWMGDWQEAVRPDHYADDYLLFPSMPDHVSHMHPDVRRTYAPFFSRALQALRTESPTNAARWVGSLLHFVQDAGSPPHTIGIGGDLHGKMERWVDEKQLDIAGYEPRLLGKTDDDALRGFEARMTGLFEFSRERATRLKPLVEPLKERTNQPLELDCALEVARVSADLLHTLFTLGLTETPLPGATIRGRTNYRPPAGYATVPAKIVLAGTDYSTTTDTEGRFEFRNLPAGRFTPWVLATGFETSRLDEVELRSGVVIELSAQLRDDSVADNLVRNSRFDLAWVKTDIPDGWIRDPRNKSRWGSAVIRVPLDRSCAVQMDFGSGKQVPVIARWRTNPSSLGGSREVPLKLERDGNSNRFQAVIAPDRTLTPFEAGVLFLEVLIETDQPLPVVCRHVTIAFQK